MTLQELRVGNLVGHVDSDEVCKVISVGSYVEFGTGVNAYDKRSNLVWIPLDSIRPLDLNPARLKMLGFKGRDDFKWYRGIGIQIKDYRFYFAHRDMGGVIYRSLLEVRSVHHMQNLAYDFGEELNIKL